MLTLKVPEMSCAHCVSAITRAVQSLDGAAKVDVDLGSHLVRVEGSVPADRIQDALRTAGYESEAVTH